MGYPGTLPILNAEAVKMAYTVARALNCTLSEAIYFDRKNYFYPDLPKNYQISQFNSPVGTDGFIDIEFHKNKKRVRIKECHLEEDAGKMIHAGDMSLCDFNRAGTPLLEIVTQPDLEVGEEAENLLQYFRRMVRYLGVCDGNMEEGSLRCDANVSVNEHGKGLGNKVEIKNMNSFKFVRKALNYEIDRQSDIIERGGTVVQETRLWNENRDVSESMRVKENANDYRYFPEPDLPPFRTDQDFLNSVESMLVELPAERKERLKNQYNLSELHAAFVCEEKEVADYFEHVAERGSDPETAVQWMSSDVRKMINRFNIPIQESPLTPERFSSLLAMLSAKRIHGKIAKQVLESVFEENKDPETIIKEKGWEQITDEDAIGAIIEKIIEQHASIVETIKNGDTKPLGFLMGQIMKATSGRAEPQVTQRLLHQKLSRKMLSVVSFSGAITGRKNKEGRIEPGNLEDIKDNLQKIAVPENVVIEIHQFGRILSEEIIPSDWSELIHYIIKQYNSGNCSGIVIGHGTDTLSYTASLLHWLFGNTMPIVLTASFQPQGVGNEAVTNLQNAIKLASVSGPGVHVSIGEETFYPLNLRYEKATGPSPKLGFKTWNSAFIETFPKPFVEIDNIPENLNALKEKIERAINSIYLTKIYPGLKGDNLITLSKEGIQYFILELFDTGTANLRETPYSLKNFFEYAADHDITVFCTSQQEGIVDFSEYITSHRIWREGALPMGYMITESVYTRLISALLCSTDEKNIVQLMEE
jgi:aspartyl-tRNA(Asn)/glutamyl-tRNA(Gln) amidotransferase subunit B